MSQEVKGKKTNSKLKSSKIGWVLLTVVIIFAAGMSAYWWRDNEAKKQAASDQKTIATMQAKITDYEKAAQAAATAKTGTEAPVSKQPTATAVDNIKASIISGNTAALEGYMANPVKVVYAASEAAGDRTPTQAINDLKYLSSATGPWNFSIDSVTLGKWQNGDYKQYILPTSLVGKSSNGYVVVFNFNSDAKINGVFMSASSDLL